MAPTVGLSPSFDLARLGPRGRRRAVVVAWLVVLALLGGLGGAAAGAFARGTDGDFVHFYEAAKAVRTGTDLYESGSRGYIYPPLPAIVMAPLSLVPQATAAVVWTGLNVLFVVAGGWLLARETLRRLDPHAAWCTACILALGLVINADKLRAVLALGQTDALTFFLLALALTCQDRRPGLCGLALGLAFNIKYQAVVFIPYFLVRGRWRELGGMLGAAAGGLLAGSLVFGWDRNLNYLGRAFAGLLAMVGVGGPGEGTARISSITWGRSVSIPSALARLGEAHGWSDLFVPGTALAAAAAALALAWWVMARWRVPLLAGRGGKRDATADRAVPVLLEWVGLVVGVLVFGPQTTVRHLFLLTVATIPAAALLLLRRPGVRRGRLFLGVVVLAAGLSLPPGGRPWAQATDTWRGVAGPAWCALVMFFALLSTGLAAANGPRSAVIRRVDAPSPARAA
jgi:hypothetical protein